VAGTSFDAARDDIHLCDHPLFDSNRYCRHLEAAYLAMRDRSAAGASPSAIEVPLRSPVTTRVTTEG
jgi:hypothetical protein